MQSNSVSTSKLAHISPGTDPNSDKCHLQTHSKSHPHVLDSPRRICLLDVWLSAITSAHIHPSPLTLSVVSYPLPSYFVELASKACYSDALEEPMPAPPQPIG